MFNKTNLFGLTAGVLMMVAFSSCKSTQALQTYGIGYQSVRQSGRHITTIPEDAKIATVSYIGADGSLRVFIKNLTDEIMVIDQTMSFVVNTDGSSTSYYDPTVKTQTVTDFQSGTKGASVGLGSVANALGIGGVVGKLMNGVTVGGSNTSGQSVTNTTYFADQPKIALAPHATGEMSKVFKLNNIGTDVFADNLERFARIGVINIDPESSNPYKKSPLRFSVCISYSLDNGESFDKIVSEYYVNCLTCIPVNSSKEINNSLRTILVKKSDALTEPCGIFYFLNSLNAGMNAYSTGGVFLDYKL